MRNIWFVSHPHVEPTILGKKVCPWNMTTRHKRKLIECEHSQFIRSIDDEINTDTIYFAGEWECCSYYRKNNLKSWFKNIHNPIFTELDSFHCVSNTDPFVLGKKFYYTCCGIKKGMKAGDMVIFGSSTGPQNTILKVDTVLIIEGVVNRFENQQVFFPSGYNEVTLSKMPLQKDVFIGQMYEDNRQIFSFVACRTDSAFDFPQIMVSHGGIYLHGGSNSNHLEVDHATFKKIYNQIIDDIIAQGFYLGVYMPMPIFDPLQVAKSPEDYDYSNYYGRLTHKTTLLKDIFL